MNNPAVKWGVIVGVVLLASQIIASFVAIQQLAGIDLSNTSSIKPGAFSGLLWGACLGFLIVVGMLLFTGWKAGAATGEAKSGAVAGLIASLIPSIIGQPITTVMMNNSVFYQHLQDYQRNLGTAGNPMASGGIVSSMINLVCGAIISVVIGAGLGWLGGYISIGRNSQNVPPYSPNVPAYGGQPQQLPYGGQQPPYGGQQPPYGGQPPYDQGQGQGQPPQR